MPQGVGFGYRLPGQINVPAQNNFLLAGGSSTVTFGGNEFTVLTTYTNLTSGGVKVTRPLIPGDKTNHYYAAALDAAPGAPTVTDVTAATYGQVYLAAGTYSVKLTWSTASGGETTGGTAATGTTMSTTDCLFVTPPAAPAGATGYNVYVAPVGTSTTYYKQNGAPLGLAQGFYVQGLGAANALVITGPTLPTVDTAGTGGLAGILGVSKYSAVTNSTGTTSSPPAFGGVNSGGQVVYPYSGPGLLGTDPTTGRQKMDTWLGDGSDIFYMQLGNGTWGFPLVGSAAGIIITGSSYPYTYTVDTTPGAGDAVLQIVGLYTTPNNYGVTPDNFVYVKVNPAYYQLNGSNVAYTSQ